MSSSICWRISEATPREPFALDAHVFAERRALLLAADAALGPRFDRARLERAIGVVPESWLCAAFPNEDPARVRASYHAFLWKRLKAPRPFVPGGQ
jgi:hypothetical protein